MKTIQTTGSKGDAEAANTARIINTTSEEILRSIVRNFCAAAELTFHFDMDTLKNIMDAEPEGYSFENLQGLAVAIAKRATEARYGGAVVVELRDADPAPSKEGPS